MGSKEIIEKVVLYERISCIIKPNEKTNNGGLFLSDKNAALDIELLK